MLVHQLPVIHIALPKDGATIRIDGAQEPDSALVIA